MNTPRFAASPVRGPTNANSRVCLAPPLSPPPEEALVSLLSLPQAASNVTNRASKATRDSIRCRERGIPHSFRVVSTALRRKHRARSGKIWRMSSELLYLRDAYLRQFTARVVDVDGNRVALDRTAFYPTGGGQPHDTGTLGTARVTEVRKEGDTVWHVLEGPVPAVGDEIEGAVDWER